MYFNIIVTHTKCVCVLIFTPPLSCFVFYRPTSGSLIPPNNAPPVFMLFIYTVFFWDTGCHIVQAGLELDSWGWPWASDSPHLHLWSARIIVMDHHIGLYTYLRLDFIYKREWTLFVCLFLFLLSYLVTSSSTIRRLTHSTECHPTEQ